MWSVDVLASVCFRQKYILGRNILKWRHLAHADFLWIFTWSVNKIWPPARGCLLFFNDKNEYEMCTRSDIWLLFVCIFHEQSRNHIWSLHIFQNISLTSKFWLKLLLPVKDRVLLLQRESFCHNWWKCACAISLNNYFIILCVCASSGREMRL